MSISWSRHAKIRFAERAIKTGINYGDIELEIKKQEIKIKQEKNKFKTIFKIGKDFLTATKIDKKDFIHVLTLWEASEKEVELWKKK
jgi:hypothetical protein